MNKVQKATPELYASMKKAGLIKEPANEDRPSPPGSTPRIFIVSSPFGYLEGWPREVEAIALYRTILDCIEQTPQHAVQVQLKIALQPKP